MDERREETVLRVRQFIPSALTRIAALIVLVAKGLGDRGSPRRYTYI